MTNQYVNFYYIEGIKEGRASFERRPDIPALEHVNSLVRTLKGFNRNSEVGQMLLGELDFWKNQLRSQARRSTGS